MKMHHQFSILPALALALAVSAAPLFIPSTAQASTYDWSGASSANMSAPANWGGTLPTSTDTAGWNAATYANMPTVDANLNFGELYFTGSNGGVTFGTNANTLTLSSTSGIGIQLDSGSGAVNTGGALFALGASQSWVNNSANTLTVSGIISDGGNNYSLTNAGTGALTLSGANTYTGGTTLTAGTLDINAAGVAGTSGSLGNGGTFTINGGTIDNTSGSAKSLANINPITLGGDFAFSTSIGTATNNLTLPGAVSMAANRTITANGAGILTFSGIIGDGGNGYSLTKAGTGTLTLTSLNTFSGGLSILNGTVNDSATGAHTNTFGTGPITLGASSGANSATLFVNVANNATGFTNALTVASGTTGTLTIGANNANLYFGGNLALNNNLMLTNANSGKAITFTGTTTETSVNSPALTVTASGGNTGHTTFSGAVVLGSGGLTFANNSGQLFTVGAGNITSTTTGSLTFNANGAGAFTVSAASINHSGSLTNSGTGSSTTTISGNIGGNVTEVVENSATSPLTLSGANTYTGGTILTAGKLNINAAGVAGTSGPLGNGGTFTINGGTIDNASGAARTLLNVNPIILGGDFAFSTSVGTTANNLALPGAVTLAASRNITANGTGVLAFGGIISDGGNAYSLTKLGTGTLTFSNANTYSGSTTISAGTLALGPGGSINNTPAISIAAGATLDVSAIASYALTSNNSLSASGTATAATLKGASGGAVNFGSQPITLAYDGSHPALTIAQGTLHLNGNSFAVNGTPLTNGTYTIVQQTSGSIVSNGTFTVTGTAIAGNHIGSIQVSGANVNLIVTSPVVVDHFAITGIPSTQTAGTAITGFTITAQDAGNNTVTGYTGFVTFGGTAGGTGTSPAFTAGVCTTASVTPTVAGSGTITVSDSGASGTTTVTVNPGALSQFVISPNPIASATAGTPFTLTSITAKDAYTNTCSTGPNTFTGTVSFSGTAGVTGTSSPFSAGVLSSPSVTATNAGSIIVTKTGGSVTGTATLTSILPGPAYTIVLTSGNNQSGIVGTALFSPFVVIVTDAYGHPISGTNVNFAIATSPVGANGQTLSATSATTGTNGQASTILTLGDTVGSYTVTATAGSLVGTFTATATAIGSPIEKAATGTELTNGASWTGGTAPNTNYVALWDDGSLCSPLTLSGATAWNGIQVSDASSNVLVTGTSPLTLGLGGIDMSGATVNLSLGLPVAFAGSQTWNVNVAKTLTVSGNISGGGFGIALTGEGTVTLSGTNNFSGGLNILNGMVSSGTVVNYNTQPFGTGPITLGDSSGGNYAYLQCAMSAIFTNDITVAAGSSGVLTIQCANNFPTNSGNLALNNNLTVNNGNTGKSVTFTGTTTETSVNSPALTITCASGGANFAGPVVIGSGGLTFAYNGGTVGFTVGPGSLTSTTTGSLTFDANSSYNFTVSAASINPSGSLTNSGTGSGTTIISGSIGANVTNVVQNSANSQLTLSGSNVFGGGLDIVNGTVSATTSTNALGAGPVYLGDISGSANATLLGDGRTFTNAILVQSGSSGTLTIGNSGNTAAVFSGSITQSNNLSLYAGGTGSVQLSGAITGPNQITTDGTNTAAYVNLSGNSPNFIGPVLIDSGVLRIGSATALNSSNGVTLNAGSILDVENSVTIAGLQDGTGAGFVTNRTANARTLTLGGSAAYSFSGTIADNSSAKPTSLVMLGAGTQTLSGTNSYTGNTTVGGGILAIQQPTLAATSTVTVSNGGVLELDFAVTNSVTNLVLNGISVTGVHNYSTDPTFLHGTGSLLVPSSIATNPTNISFTVTGGTNLNMSWPLDHLGWLVQSNSVNLGVSADWYDISNTATGTNYNITIHLNQPNVFYRLRKP